jgi:hypothetical protein
VFDEGEGGGLARRVREDRAERVAERGGSKVILTCMMAIGQSSLIASYIDGMLLTLSSVVLVPLLDYVDDRLAWITREPGRHWLKLIILKQ